MKDYLSSTIESRAAAIGFIKSLVNDGLLFHFDDSAADVGRMENGQWLQLFTPEEAAAMNARVDELFSIAGFDPFRASLTLSKLSSRAALKEFRALNSATDTTARFIQH